MPMIAWLTVEGVRTPSRNLVAVLTGPWPVSAMAFFLAARSACDGLVLDQLIFYQAGLRAAQGQIPGIDFVLPQGFLTAAFLAPFFALIPGGGVAWLVASGVLNAAYCALVWDLLHTVTADRRSASLGAALSAIWFLPPFGSAYCDHLAYLCLVAGLWLTTKGRDRAHGLLAGALVALAYHAKQPIGVFGAAAWVIGAWIGPRGETGAPRWSRAGLTGFFLLHAIVLTATWLGGGLPDFVTYNILWPLRIAAGQTEKSVLRTLTFLVSPWHVLPLAEDGGFGQLAILPMVAAAYLSLAICVLRPPRSGTLFFLILSRLWSAATLGRLHAHVTFGVPAALVLSLHWHQGGRIARALGWGLIAAVGVSGLFFTRFGHEEARSPHPHFATTDLWPIRVEDAPSSRALARISAALRNREGKIAVAGFGGFLLSVALRRPPAQNYLSDAFPPVVMRSAEFLGELDRRFSDTLADPDVRFAVAQTNHRLESEIRSNGNYALILSAGPWRLYERYPRISTRSNSR